MKELSGDLIGKGLGMGLVVSRFNDFLTKQLLEGAVDCLVRHGVDEKSITTVWVPGAYEAPMALEKMASVGGYDALVALGAVIQGATPHAGLIEGQVSRSLAQIAMRHGVPVIDGIVSANTLEQAIERAGTKAGNRGWRSALAAIEMANLYKKI